MPGGEDDRTEADYLADLLVRGVCPWCGKWIPEGKRVGSGRKADGGFCSLDCYTKYYEQELVNRARRVATLLQTLTDTPETDDDE
jgi:hypothetical protein